MLRNGRFRPRCMSRGFLCGKRRRLGAAAPAAVVGGLVAAPTALAGGNNETNGFVWFSNHTVAVGLPSAYRRRGGSQELGWRFGSNARYAYLEVNNGVGNHFHFNPDPRKPNC